MEGRGSPQAGGSQTPVHPDSIVSQGVRNKIGGPSVEGDGEPRKLIDSCPWLSTSCLGVRRGLLQETQAVAL